ncbi:MAG: hypothetical protein E6I85_03380 [Chloroflexi bacterium]|nr:MAG: hypothetical protein E6I85_03380 [Chloroflexota bacterium]
MNSRARVEAALKGAPVDRPPAGAWGHTYREEWSPEQLARVTVERQRRYGWDYVKFQPRASCFAEAFGARFQGSNHSLRSPKELEHPIHGHPDWPRLPGADASAPSLAEQVEALRLTVAQLGPEVPVLQTVFSPITVAGYLVGRDKRRAVRDLRKHPDEVLPALDRIATTLIDFSRRSVEAGAAGIFYAVSGYASEDLLSAEEYDRWLAPLDQRVLESLPEDAWFNVLHLCRGHLHFELARRLPVQAVSWAVQDPGGDGRPRAAHDALPGNPGGGHPRGAGGAQGDRGDRAPAGAGLLGSTGRAAGQPGGDDEGGGGVTRTVTGLAEIVLWTHDMERSLAFYRDLFGLELISPPEVPARFLSTGELSGGVPGMIVLSPHPDGAGGGFPTAKRERVLHHLAFKVAPDRYQELRGRCEAAGLEVRGGIHPVLKGVRTFYVDDPEGNEVEVIGPDV